MTARDYGLRGFVDGAIRRWLSFATAGLMFLWFSGFPNYFRIVYLPALTPAIWVGFTLCIVLLDALARDSWTRPLNSTFVVWWVGVMLMNLAWYGGFGGGDASIFKSRISALMLLACAYFAFATCPLLIDRVRRGFIFVVLLAVGLNVYDLIHPSAFIPAGNEFQIFTRPSGIYMNPNIAGSSIVFGLLLSIEKVVPRWRMAFVLMCVIGVILSLSRASILAMFLAIVALLFNGTLSRQAAWQLCVIFGAVTVAVGAYLWPLIGGLLGSDGLERVLWFADPGNVDFSQEERLFLAARGWEQFVAHPFVGNGVGSTELWGLSGSTHNQYLQYLSDFGILGGLVVPGLAIGLCTGVASRYSTPCLVAGYILFFSLFTNNMLDEYAGLIAVAIAAALPRKAPAVESTCHHVEDPVVT